MIDAVSGAIKSREILYYDATGLSNIYTLYVEAQDSGVPSLSSIATVNIGVTDANDHSPQFTQATYLSGTYKKVHIAHYIS